MISVATVDDALLAVVEARGVCSAAERLQQGTVSRVVLRFLFFFR